MEKLVPINVPWKVAPSTPKLQVIYSDENSSIVSFVALFGLEKDLCATDRTAVKVVDNIQVDSSDKSGRYQHLKGSFKDVGWVRCNPQISDREVIKEDDYDWSQVRGCQLEKESLKEWRERVFKEWDESGICPDSSVYFVENSSWLAETGAAKWGLVHFLILGDCCSVEILAKDVDWHSEGRVIGW